MSNTDPKKPKMTASSLLSKVPAPPPALVKLPPNNPNIITTGTTNNNNSVSTNSGGNSNSTTPPPSSPSTLGGLNSNSPQPSTSSHSPIFKSVLGGGGGGGDKKTSSGNLNSSSSGIPKSSLGFNGNSPSSQGGSPHLFNRTNSTLAQFTSSSLPNPDSSPPTSSLNSSSSSPTTESLLYTNEDASHDPFTKMGNIYLGLKSITAGEAGHIGHTCVCSEDALYYFGGQLQDGSYTNDFYSFQISNRNWSLLSSPSGVAQRSQHTSVIWNNSMYVFGGHNNSGSRNDIFVYSFETQLWSEFIVEGSTKPSGRYGHSAIVDGSSMIIFGGILENGQLTNEIYSLSFENKTWNLLISPGSPSGRTSHTATLHKGQMWIIGGQDSTTNPVDEIYTYSFPNNNWNKIQLEGSSFTPRTNHTSTLFQDSIIVIGGNSTKPISNSLEIFEIDLYQKKCYRIQTSTHGHNRSLHQAFNKNGTIFLWGGNGNDTSVDYFSFGKDEFEEEYLPEDDVEFNRIQNIPKNYWESTLMKKHPEILDLRERTQMLTGIKSYGMTLAQPSFTENKNAISQSIVLQLIMDYLERHTPYHKTIAAIQKETGIIHQLTESGESKLVSLLRLAKPRLRNKNVFDSDLDILPRDDQSTDPEFEFVDNLYRRIENEEEDINVWDEGDDNPRNIKKTESSADSAKISIKAATLNKLVHYLAPEKDKANDVNFLKTFLYTYASFTTPETLLKKIIQRYNVPPSHSSQSDPKYKSEFVDPIRNRVCGVLKYWIDKCPWDFKSGMGADKLVSSLNNFIDGSLTRDGNANIKKLRSLLIQVRTNELASSLVYSTNPPEPKVPKNIFSPQLNLIHIDELEIARQLTLIEYRIFRNIPPPEFLVRVTNFGDFQYSMATSPNLITYLNRSNDVARWVVYTVLNLDKKRDRVKMMEKHLKIMESLRTLNNFQTLYSIYQGLQHSYLQSNPDIITPRIKEIVLTDYDNLFSKNDNYKNYREVLSKSSHPCIPLITVVQEDIAYIEKEQPSQMSNLINFVKRQNLYNIIAKLEEFQLRPYNLQPVHQISTFINKLPKVSDNDLSDLATRPTS